MNEQRFTAAEKAEAAEREVEMRKRVYSQREMTKFYKRQIAIMQEIAADYRAQAEKERLL